MACYHLIHIILLQPWAMMQYISIILTQQSISRDINLQTSESCSYNLRGEKYNPDSVRIWWKSILHHRYPFSPKQNMFNNHAQLINTYIYVSWSVTVYLDWKSHLQSALFIHILPELYFILSGS